MILPFVRNTLVLAAVAVTLLGNPLSSSAAEKVIAKGTLTGIADHGAQGSVKIVRTGSGVTVRFGGDLSFDRVPDAWLAFGKNGKLVESSYVAMIKANQGAQSYAVPARLTIGDYDTVYVWCRKFNVGIGAAKLN